MWIKGFWFPTSNVSASIPEKLPTLGLKKYCSENGRLLLSYLDIKRGILRSYINNRGGNLACAHVGTQLSS